MADFLKRNLPYARFLAVKLGATLIVCLAITVGCDGSLFNPAFVNEFGGNAVGTSAGLESAAGHVVVAFANRAEVDERLIAFLESAEGGNLQFTPEQRQALRPRVRFRIQIDYAQGGDPQVVEFVSGSSELVDQSFDVVSEPDLNQNDLDNVVVLCDVSNVSLVTGADIEVFMPVPIDSYNEIEVLNTAGNVIGLQLVLDQTQQPQFIPLAVDDVDQDLNVVERRNIGIRDVLSPVVNPRCGSVVAIEMTGVLTAPFLPEFDDPSYDNDDDETINTLGGRFEFTVSVR